MANFTDTQVLPYLTSYKPYVQQQNPDVLLQVGQIKQQKYEQGVTRIQSEIDKVAGMDIVRPVDREYLKTKLSALNSQLNWVAAADFSNFQLTNSVGGMISSIAKDNNIRNAYASTMKYRQGVSDMENAVKEGKSSPSNEWDFSNQVNKWMSSPNLKDTFNGGYQPYTNYKKNAIELIKNLKPDANISENAFTYDKNGKLTIADAIVRKELKGIDPKKIQEALLSGLTPGDFKQLEIDGRYNYSNATPEALHNRLNSSYDATLSSYNDQKRVLQNALSSTTSLVAQNQIKDQIANLDKTISGIGKEQESLNGMLADGNFDAVKAHLHTNEFINNFSRAFSYTETEESYKDSPFVKNMHWKAEQDWDRLKFQYQYSQKERELGLKKYEIDLKKKELEPRFGGLGSPIDEKLLPNITPQQVLENTIKKEENLNALDKSFYESPALGGKGKEWFDQQLKAYQEGKPLSEPVKRYIEATNDSRMNLLSDKAMLTSTRNEAYKEAGITNIDDFINEAIPRDSKPVEVSGQVYTPREFVDFNSKIRDLQLELKSTPLTFSKQKEIESGLSTKELNLFHALLTQNRGYLNEDQRTLVSELDKYNNLVNKATKSKLQQLDELTNQKLKERITSPQGVIYDFTGSKPEQQREASTEVLGDFINFAEKHSGEIAGAENFDIETARRLAADPKTQYKFDLNEGTEYQEPTYTITAFNGEKEVSFPVTKEQKIQKFGNMFEASSESKYANQFTNQIRKAGGITTAIDGGETTHENAFIQKPKFTNPNLKYYGLNANVTQVGDNRYILNLNIYDPIKREWYDNVQYPVNGSVDKEALGTAFGQIDTNVLFSLIHGENMTREDETQLKKESAKPF